MFLVVPKAMRAAVFALLALAAGCGASPPSESSPPPPAGAPAPEPSPGCRPGTLPAASALRGSLEGRSWLLDAPEAPADRPLPVVFAFHGFRDVAVGLRAGSGLEPLARTQGFIAVFPQGHEGVRLLGTTGRGWDMRPTETQDRDFVAALLDRLEAERCVDRRRIYATGMSNGGFFAGLLGCLMPERFAAVAAVAGGMALEGCRPARPVPVLLIYGTADQVVPLDMMRSAGEWWSQANGCGGSREDDGCRRYERCRADVLVCEHPSGHRWPDGSAERIWRFFRAHPEP